MNDRYGAAERAAVLRKFASCGLEPEAFATWAGIAPGRLRQWLRAGRAPEIPALDWVEVELTEPETEAGSC